jgi:hypothetical protein
MMRMAWVVSAIAMVSGCTDCGPKPVADCTDTTATFTGITSGATVSSPLDAFSVDIKSADGSAFPIDAATVSIGGMTFTGMPDGSRATFTGVTAAAGAQTLSVTIGAGSCSKTYASLPITVMESACTTPSVTAVTFPQDVAPLGVLNSTELPAGTNLTVEVQATCTAGVQVRIKRGTEVVGPLTSFTNGRATVTLPTLPDADIARYDLFAELVRDGQPVNTLSSNPAAGQSIQIARAAPVIALTVGASFGPNDDADAALAGFQVRVTGTAPIDSTCTIGVTGQPPVPANPVASGDVSADFTVSSGSFTATLTCTDVNGNVATTTADFVVDFTPPVVTIVSPANVDGGATMTITQSPVSIVINATGAEDGSMVKVYRNGTEVNASTILNGAASVPVSFGSDGTYTIRVTVTDLAGNVGEATIVVDVTLDGCGAQFVRPMSCPALLTPAQLSNGTYSFQTRSKVSCANQPAALFRADVLADGGLAAEVASGSASINGAGVAAFPPLTLASGDYVFRGEITNIGVDAGVAVDSCRVTVDLDGPVITNPVVPTGSTFATINVSQDTQPATPGVQRTLSFSSRVPMGGRVDVCTTQAVDPVTMAPRPTTTECGSGWYALQQNVTSPAPGFSFPDGSYQLKVVVVGGGLAVPSPAVAVFVDSVRPCVSGLTRALPQDLNGDGRLNIAELNGAAPRLEFQLGCGDTSTATLAATNPVVVRDIVSGAAGAVRASTSSFAAGKYTVTLTGPYATEVDLNLFVELTDLANNKNLLAASNDPATFALRIDPVAPTCTITSPSAAQTLFGIAQVPGGNFNVAVATSADVSTGGVSVTFTGQAARQLTPTLSQASTTYALTGDATYTVGASCTDQSGNAANATARTARVDLLAPTCNITAPADGASSGSTDVTTTVAVTGLTAGDPTSVTISSSVAGIQNNQLTVSGSTATGTVSYANGTQTITATISDAAGNACVASAGGRLSGQLTVNSSSCSLTFPNGSAISSRASIFWLNRAGAGLASGVVATSTNVSVAVATDCGAGRNVYLYQGAPSLTPSGTPVATAAGGTATLPAPGSGFQEGQQWTVTIDNGAGVLTHRSFYVSLVEPAIGSIGFQRSSTVTTIIPVPANSSLVFGAASGNRRVETATATDRVFADLDPGTADAQFQLALTAITGARFAPLNLNGELDVFEGTTALNPTVVLNTASFDSALPPLKLGHRLDDTTVDLVIRVTSPSGNTFVSRHASEVDVIAPATPSVTQTLASARAATVNLSWAAVYDDGSDTGSGGLNPPTAGFDIRWTTSSVPNNNSMAAIADYFGSSSKQDGVASWVAGTNTKSLTLPPLNTYFISVRACDEVGNYSTWVAPTSLANGWSMTAFSAPVASSSFGSSLKSDSLIGNDTTPDLVVAAPLATGGGAVYVYDSTLIGTTQTGCGAGCQALTPPTAAGSQFGHDLSVGNVGAVGAEVRSDLLIAGLGGASPVFGRAVLYFGTTAATFTVSDAIEFRGLDTNNRIGTALATSAQIIRDISGDGLDEIAFAAPSQSSNRGRILIFRGRSRSAWAALATATDTTVVPNLAYVPVSAATADYVIDGPTPLLVSPAGNAFGQNRRGLISVNDIDADGFPDLAVPTSRQTINQYRIIGSAAIKASTGASPLDSTAGYVQLLTRPVGADNSTTSGLASAAFGNIDIYDSSGADLAVSLPGVSPANGLVYLFSSLGGTPTSPSPSLTLTGPSRLGSALALGRLDSDTAMDLVASTDNTSNNTVWVLYQRAATFETAILDTAPAFWVSKLSGTTITGNSSSRLGSALAVTSVGDLVVGDSFVGEVRVWR